MDTAPARNSLRKIYMLSGLGADERAFQNLDLSGYEVIFIKWITPLHNEKIAAYAYRLLDQIDDPKPILVGLSFGGLIAIEIAKHIEVGKLILISSAKTGHEIPFYFKLSRLFGLHRHIPDSFLNKSNRLTEWFFGPKTMEDGLLLRQILKDTDPCFFKWAIGQLVHWKNQTLPPNSVHIHGSADRIFPRRFIHSDIMVKDAGHLMILNRSNEINRLLLQSLITA